MDKGVDFVLNSIIETKSLSQVFRNKLKKSKEKAEEDKVCLTRNKE